jgi:hypothetical protein
VFRCIADTLWQVILLEFLDIDYRAHLLTQPTINTLLHIHFRIPKAFIVGLESNSLFRARIATSVAATTIYFILNVNHCLYYSIVFIFKEASLSLIAIGFAA